MAKSKKARSAAARQARTNRRSKEKDAAVDFAEEYRYVIGDLKRVGILAAAMFALLVTLALIVP